MDRDGATRRVASVWPAPMNRQAVMKGDLPFPNVGWHSDHRLPPTDELLLQLLQMTTVEVESLVGVVRPAMASIKEINRAHRLVTVMKGDPCCQHRRRT